MSRMLSFQPICLLLWSTALTAFSSCRMMTLFQLRLDTWDGKTYHIQFVGLQIKQQLDGSTSWAIYLLKATPHDLQAGSCISKLRMIFLEYSFLASDCKKKSLEVNHTLINPYYKQWCLDVGLYGYPLQLHVFARGTPHQDVDDDRGEGRFLLKATPTLNLTNMPRDLRIPPKNIQVVLSTLPETNIFAPENGWLEDFLLSFWGV